MMHSLTRIFFKLLGITLLFLLFIEILTRIILGSPPTTSMVMPDPILNHKLRPDLVYRDYSRPIPYTVYTNSQSWPERYDIPVKKPARTLRIFYVGDSNTQGVVDDGKKMVNIVANGLHKRFDKNNRKLEVINTGTSSYSPSIYYLVIKDYILKYSPDIVVINVDMTDAQDDSIYRRLTKFDIKGLPVRISPASTDGQSRYLIAPQGLIRISNFAYVVSQIHSFLYQHSAFYFHFENSYLTLRWNGNIRNMLHKTPTSTAADVPPISADSWLTLHWSTAAQKNVDYSMFLLQRTIALLHEHHVKVVVTSVPHYPQYIHVWNIKPHEIVAQTATGSGALYFNSYQALQKTIVSAHQNIYYWANDLTHFNQEGSRIWGEAQLNFLIAHGKELGLE